MNLRMLDGFKAVIGSVNERTAAVASKEVTAHLNRHCWGIFQSTPLRLARHTAVITVVDWTGLSIRSGVQCFDCFGEALQPKCIHP